MCPSQSTGRRSRTTEDGKVTTWPLKLVDKRFRRGVDLVGHRHLSVDPCHIDMWLNSSKMTSRPVVPNGDHFTHDLWAAVGGIGIEPL